MLCYFDLFDYSYSFTFPYAQAKMQLVQSVAVGTQPGVHSTTLLMRGSFPSPSCVVNACTSKSKSFAMIISSYCFQSFYFSLCTSKNTACTECCCRNTARCTQYNTFNARLFPIAFLRS